MKNITRKLLAILMASVLVCLLIPVGAVTAAEDNLVANGDFETGDSNGWFTHQSTVITAEAAKDGGYGAYVQGNGGWGGLLNQTLEGLEVGATYRFSFDYKTLSSGVNVKLTSGTTDKGETYGYCYATKTEWTQFAVEFEAIESVAFLNLCGPGNNKAESMYIDNIKVEKVVLGGGDSDPNLKMMQDIQANVKTQGRTAMINGTLMLDFALSGIEFELDCSGDVYATFNARKLSSTSATGGIYFTVVVDGVKLARDYCRITTVGETKVLLAEGLPAGKHTFAIYRQSEHQYGEIGVCSLSFDGTILDKPADKELYIEFIGDSISNGYGVLGNSKEGDGSALWSDATQAYNFLTAQALNADFSNPSWSGLGCKYGYSSVTMQDVYPAQRYNYDKTTAYDFAKEPDIVVLALGTNDNSKGPDTASIRAGLKEMLTLVRAKNPNAPIIWIYGMMTDNLNTMIQEIVAEYGGEAAGYYACELTTSTNGGGWHPSVAGQKKFADELVAFIKAKGLNIPADHVHEYDGVCDAECNTCGTTRDVHTKLVHFDAIEAGCHMNGRVEYWYCPDCEGFWTDAALTQVTNSKNVVIPAKGGNVVAHEAIAPNCHMNGQIAYWYCAECEQFWADEALTQLTNSKNVILPATGSDKVEHVAAKAATETEKGNIEYWYCPDCDQYWTDEALTKLTNSKNVLIAATGNEQPEDPTDPEDPADPDSPVTGDSVLPVVVALLTLIASGVAVSVLKKRA